MVCEAQWKDYFQLLKQRMGRLKETDPGDMKTDLKRCLSTRALTFLGAGNTIGVGIYVLLGIIAKENAGPSTVLCFLIAITVTLMNALVYAEFSSSVTQTGAAYMFFYKVGGEFLAFICGWLMILSFMASGCVSARAWSGLLDSFFNNTIQDWSKDIFGEIQFGRPFADSIDPMAFLFQLTLTIIVSCNVHCSSILNTTLSVLTISVLVFVAIAGPIFGDASNFINADRGGFFPFGLVGVMKGASMAIYACSGFEVVAMSAEEAKNPQKSVPVAIIFELVIVALVYVGASIGILFLIPYWMIDTKAPLPSAFDHNGMVWGKFFVTLGPLFSFCNLQMLGLYGLSRIVYRMAADGLFFSWFLKVNKKTGVPVNSVLSVGILMSGFSLLLDLSFLVEVTILLMLITFIFLGSALIKLKVTPKTSSYVNEEKSQNISTRDTQTLSGQGLITSDNSVNNNGILEREIVAVTDFTMNDVEDGKQDNNGVGNFDSLQSGSEDKAATVSFKEENGTEFSEKTHDDCEFENEDVTLFEKGKEGNKSSKLSKKEYASISVTSLNGSGSFRLVLAKILSPLVPGVLSVNTVIFMHWLCCIALALQLNHGYGDIMNGSVVALLGFSLLVLLLVVLTFLLWLRNNDDSMSGFKTPLMPVVPTLSMLTSCILFFSSAKLVGLIELLVLSLLGSVLYFILVWLDMKAVGERPDQTISLIGNDDDEDL